MNELNILQEKWDRLQTKMTTLECAVLKSKSVNAAAELAAMQARIEKLEAVENAARKMVNLRGVAHGTWVVEELEAALRDVK